MTIVTESQIKKLQERVDKEYSKGWKDGFDFCFEKLVNLTKPFNGCGVVEVRDMQFLSDLFELNGDCQGEEDNE